MGQKFHTNDQLSAIDYQLLHFIDFYSIYSQMVSSFSANTAYIILTPSWIPVVVGLRLLLM